MAANPIYLRYEDGVMTIPYTPSGADVAAGDVVVIGELIGICVRPIADGELGCLNVGGGVYSGVGDSNGIDAGEPVYWDDTNNKLTGTSGSAFANKFAGYAITDCAGDGEYFDFFHVTPAKANA